MEWCKHCSSTGGNQLTIEEGFGRDDFRWSISDGIAVKFCPICGTPRPKETSLEEKFLEAHVKGNPSFGTLAEIARKHFESPKP